MKKYLRHQVQIITRINIKKKDSKLKICRIEVHIQSLCSCL